MDCTSSMVLNDPVSIACLVCWSGRVGIVKNATSVTGDLNAAVAPSLSVTCVYTDCN